GRRTHTQEVPRTRAVPHRPDILQRPLAAALQGREPAPREQQAAQPGTRSLELRCSEVPANRRLLPARQKLVHLLHPRLLYSCTLFLNLSPVASKRGNPFVRSMNGFSDMTIVGNAGRENVVGGAIVFTSRPRIQRYTRTGVFVWVRTLFVTLPSTTAE